MRAAQVTKPDGPAGVEIVDVPDPIAGDRVLIEVQVAGVSFPDLLLSKGEYQFKPAPPFIPGSEVSGIVLSAPDGSPFVEGRRVAAFPALGGFAEQVAVDPRMVFDLPDRVSFDAAAALPMNYLTVHFALLRRGRLRAGETVLVHGAAGGVGTAAVQFAAAHGARVIAVVSTEAKAEVARRAGAHEVVPVDGFKDAVADLTGGQGVDIVVDPVGGDRFTDSLRSLTGEGRLLVIGFTGGEIPTVKVNRLLLNNIEVVGAAWGEYWMRRPEYLREQWAELFPLLESGAIDPPIGSVYPLERTGDALAELDERRAHGKVLVRVR